ncbi:hypothetical protein CLV92_103352 [Kineococcus xinjiangensis]|uniref:Glycerophosphoryl diester phosphodiesterase family protein n=1 Tax=Kineococcus xinjiangensis TaxID=512762 RepID=A0A2S6IU83_9ACTN|nr:hypothetical protein [Kineococcus xinjiangensis]PPK97817.1 hypothetical protein CLV92_103352 [Kineococcus xinjiangensis]
MNEGTAGGDGPGGASWQQPHDGGQSQWSAPAGGGQHGTHGGPAHVPGAPTGAGPAWGVPPVARPGIVPLRPLGLGEIYDGAFRAFRQNPRVMVGLSAIVVAITTLVSLVPLALLTSDLAQLGAAGDVSDEVAFAQMTTMATRSLPGFLLALVLQFVAITVLNGLLIVAVSRAVLGDRVPLGELWHTARGRVWALIGLSMLFTLVYLVLLLVALGPGIALLALDRVGAGVAVLLLSSLAALVVGVWAYVRWWSLAAPALLLEGIGVGASLSRSARLVRGSFWRVLGVLLLTGVIVYAVVTAISVPFQVLSLLLSGAVLVTSGGETSFLSALVQQAVIGAGTILGSAVAYPFSASVTALLYIDLRMRREGLDVELHRAAAARPGPEHR